MSSSAPVTVRGRHVVVVSPMAAVRTPTTAGGLLLSRIVESHLAAGAEVTVLTPWMRVAAADLERTPPVAPTRLLGRPRDRQGVLRLLLVLTHRLSARLLSHGTLLPWPPLVVDLLGHRELRRLLREADVVDLQWEEYGRLVRLIRRLAPRAVVVATFHDVISQRIEREAGRAEEGLARRRATRALARARRLEARTTAELDVSYVLSEKDEHLLRAVRPDARIRVVDPPLVDPGTPLVDLAGRPAVLGFVSYLRRHENRDAALRLVERIWPAIRAALPDARLLIIGGGIEDEPSRRLRAVPGVELTGFVEDLDEAYSRLRATLSPVDRGAGVKFKVLESVVRGLPTLTTTVGAEGIDPGLLTAVLDEDAALTEAAITALTDPAAAAAARSAAVRARERYGVDRFRTHYHQAVDDALAAPRRPHRKGRR